MHRMFFSSGAKPEKQTHAAPGASASWTRATTAAAAAARVSRDAVMESNTPLSTARS
jgi:hypothetical protein